MHGTLDRTHFYLHVVRISRAMNGYCSVWRVRPSLPLLAWLAATAAVLRGTRLVCPSSPHPTLLAHSFLLPPHPSARRQPWPPPLPPPSSRRRRLAHHSRRRRVACSASCNNSHPCTRRSTTITQVDPRTLILPSVRTCRKTHTGMEHMRRRGLCGCARRTWTWRRGESMQRASRHCRRDKQSDHTGEPAVQARCICSERVIQPRFSG